MNEGKKKKTSYLQVMQTLEHSHVPVFSDQELADNSPNLEFSLDSSIPRHFLTGTIPNLNDFQTDESTEFNNFDLDDDSEMELDYQGGDESETGLNYQSETEDEPGSDYQHKTGDEPGSDYQTTLDNILKNYNPDSPLSNYFHDSGNFKEASSPTTAEDQSLLDHLLSNDPEPQTGI